MVRKHLKKTTMKQRRDFSTDIAAGICLCLVALLVLALWFLAKEAYAVGELALKALLPHLPTLGGIR